MMKLVRPLALLISLLWACGVAAAERVALVIGVGSYPYLGALKRPPTDAKDVADFLRSKGYKIHLEQNAKTKAILVQKTDQFLNDIREKSKSGLVDAAIYYSGHGFEAEKNNWLISGDFDPTGYSRRDKKEVFKKFAVSLESLLSSVKKAGAKNVVVVLDACRDTRVEFADSSMVSVGFDVASSSIPRDFFALFASSREQPAYSEYPGDSGKNSVFTHFFLMRLAERDYELSALLNVLQKDVETATANRRPSQSPSGYDAISGDYYFATGVTGQPQHLAQAGSPINVFYQQNREADAQTITGDMRKAGLFYGLTADDFKQVRGKLSPGSYRIVRSSEFSAADQSVFDRTLKILEDKAGKGNVVVKTVPPSQIINKPFQVQLF